MSSASEFGKDMGVLHELVVTGRKAGWTGKDYGTLAHSGEIMQQLRFVLNGHGSLIIDPMVVDGDALPRIPKGGRLHRHRPTGFFKWDTKRVHLRVLPAQRSSSGPDGHEILRRLEEARVCNVNLIDFLLQNQTAIPEAWEGQCLYAWGTIFGDDDSSYVPGMRYSGGRWRGYGRALYERFHASDAALVFAP